MIEYAYTTNAPGEITEHRRLNLKLFCIRLKSETYKNVAPTSIYFYGRILKSEKGNWLKNGKTFSFDAERRIEAYQESRKPDLKVVGGKE